MAIAPLTPDSEPQTYRMTHRVDIQLPPEESIDHQILELTVRGTRPGVGHDVPVTEEQLAQVMFDLILSNPEHRMHRYITSNTLDFTTADSGKEKDA